MEINTWRSHTKDDLEKELVKAQSHLKTLQFKLAANQLKNVREARKTKQQIAQLHTLLREKRT